MFYHIKTAIMKGGIAKRQKKPFDYESAEAFSLAANDDDTINNSYYFSAHDYDGRESLYCRLGLRNCHSEIWFCYEKDGEVYFCPDELAPCGGEPLSVCKVDGEWRIHYDGKLIDAAGKSVAAKFDGVFSSELDAVDFFTHMPPVRTAKAMAQERWSKKFFTEVRANNQVHYEQFGMLEGTLEIDGERMDICLPCVRDHSFGKRDWNYMNNHMWLMAVNETEQLNFSMVSYPALTALEMGNFKPHGKPMKFVVRADYDRVAIADGVVPQKIELVLTLDDGEKLDVVAHKTNELNYEFQGGQYRFVEATADFDINGKKFRGIAEIGVNADRTRVYNGRDPRKIKA